MPAGFSMALIVFIIISSFLDASGPADADHRFLAVGSLPGEVS
jgi:hypothetical protein